ncbi:MAG: hypothetical protein NT141_01360 [candidate division WWE3 bacterium]|nr:hypothetical protein [candidate division WWE3 bacterium]
MIKNKNSEIDQFAAAIAIILIFVSIAIAIGMFLASTKPAKGETIPAPTIHVTLPSTVTLGVPFTMIFRSDIGNLTLVAPPFEGTVSPVAVNDQNVTCTDMLYNFDVWGCTSHVEYRWVVTATELGTHVFGFESYGDTNSLVASSFVTTTVVAPSGPVISATVPTYVAYERPFTVTFTSSGGANLLITSPFEGTSSPYATDGSGQHCLHIGVNPDKYSCPVDLEMVWVMVPRILGSNALKFTLLDDVHNVSLERSTTVIVFRQVDKIYHQWLSQVSN